MTALQCSFMHESGAINAVFILRRLLEDYCAMRKSCVCFVDLEKVFDIVLRKVL